MRWTKMRFKKKKKMRESVDRKAVNDDRRISSILL